jgi:hypothetical protein
MKCGDRGHVNAEGQPCQQTIGVRAAACIWHSRDAEGRRLLALKGGIASRMRSALPATTPEPPFDSPENIVAWAQQMAHAALTQDVDPRRMAEARGFASLALGALSAKTQQQLVDALLRLEHGGTAFSLLAQIRGRAGEVRQLPWKKVEALPPKSLNTQRDEDARSHFLKIGPDSQAGLE